MKNCFAVGILLTLFVAVMGAYSGISKVDKSGKAVTELAAYKAPIDLTYVDDAIAVEVKGFYLVHTEDVDFIPKSFSPVIEAKARAPTSKEKDTNRARDKLRC